jgi:thiamine pyrophosphokinase
MLKEPPGAGQAVLHFARQGGDMRATIIAAGQVDEGSNWQRWVWEGDWIIGADGGAARALEWGLVPHLVIGDMDSLADQDRQALAAHGCRFVTHPRAKDETDLELALTEAAQAGANEIVVLGALGGRIDHTLSNLLLLALPALEGVNVHIAGGAEEAVLVRSHGAVTLRGRPGDLVSLLPLGGDARGVTSRGLAWALQDETLRFGFSRGVSNEMTSSLAEIELTEGFLLVVHGIQPEPV